MRALSVTPILLVGATFAASAQNITYDQNAFRSDASHYDQRMLASIPPAVVAKVKAAPVEQNRDIQGKVFFKDQIMKAETIRFADFSTLILTDPTLPWVAIAAKELVIESPDGKAMITRPTTAQAEAEFAKKLAGANGGNGANGRNATGVNQHGHGYPGGDGGNGLPGTDGQTQQLPLLYIFAGKIRWGTTPSEPPEPGLLVVYDGIRGGHGGIGGTGGTGGNGYRGDNGDTTAVNCRKGPGNGGDGGFGGRGGRGGNAGRGGDGGSVVLAGPDKIIADFILARQEGGPPGDVGLTGISNHGGAGGQGGGPNGWCHGNGSNGANRSTTYLPALGNGDFAPEGLRGRKDYVGFAVELVF